MKKLITLIEPTSEQCSSNSILDDKDGVITFSCWYPQMGGYASHCIVRATKQPSRNNACFDAWIWHDGEFPFGGCSPVKIHHCDADQFINFGKIILRLASS